MKIDRILTQHRRDFRAIYECQGCGHKCENRGYDDANFHKNVIPNMPCPKCGETTKTLNVDYRPLTTKYPEGYEI